MTNPYDAVNALWVSHPPITRIEAYRAARRIRRHFKMSPSPRVRTVWVSLRGGNADRGWARIVHDLSHRLSRIRYPRLRQHGPHHAAVESEMASWVLAQGWFDGKLQPKEAPKQTDQDKVARLQARLSTWESKRRRAENAIKTITKKLRYYERKTA